MMRILRLKNYFSSTLPTLRFAKQYSKENKPYLEYYIFFKNKEEATWEGTMCRFERTLKSKFKASLISDVFPLIERQIRVYECNGTEITVDIIDEPWLDGYETYISCEDDFLLAEIQYEFHKQLKEKYKLVDCVV